MYLLYSALLALALLIGSPYWILEMLRHGKYRNGLTERFGLIPGRIKNSGQPSIWVHAVSVGEVLAVSELIRRLRSESPNRQIFVSTTTATGQRLAASLYGGENVFYFPLDFSFAVRKWMRALRPELVVVAETEFWPNFLRVAHENGARIAIVNARISDRSLPGYRRWRKLLQRVLSDVDIFLAQTSEDAHRLVEIGAPKDRVFTGGNLKYDIPPPAFPEIVGRLRSSLAQSGAGPVVVFGSTVAGEEPMIIEAFKTVLATYPSAVMLLAPRHPQRFSEVGDLLSASKIHFSRRSTWKGEALAGGVLLVDSIGELSSLYSLAGIAFVGGSLVSRGGHNIIEPAQFGVPILVGPHTENFREIVGLFRSHDAVRVVEPSELAPALLQLLGNDAERQALGKRAAEALESQRGATELALRKLNALMAEPVREGAQA